jgi:hypothetical protein
MIFQRRGEPGANPKRTIHAVLLSLFSVVNNPPTAKLMITDDQPP